MNRFMKPSFAVFAALALSACPGPGSERPATAAVPEPELRAFWNPSCIMSGQEITAEAGPFIGLLLSAVLPSLIDKGLEFSARALREAGKASTVHHERVVPAHFYGFTGEAPDIILNLNPELRCLIVAKARFAPPAEYVQYKAFGPRLQRLGIYSDPIFYFEAAAEISGDKTAFRLKPVTTIYGDNLEAGVSKANRDVVMTVSFSKPGVTDPFALATYHLGKMTPPVVKAAGSISDGWMPLPALSEDNEAAVKNLAAELTRYRSLSGRKRVPSEDALDKARRELKNLETERDKKNAILLKTREVAELEQKVAAEHQAIADKALLEKTWNLNALEPVNVLVRIDETKDANPILTFAADVLDGSKTAIRDTALKELDPAQKAAAKKQKAEAEATRLELEATKRTAAIGAYYEFKIKEVNYLETEARPGATTLEKLAAKRDMELARQNMLLAYSRIGEAPPS